MEENI